MNKKGSLFLLAIFLFCLLAHNDHASAQRRSQREDSLIMNSFSIRKPRSPWLAAGLSLVLPGAGQFYNGKSQYWKTPSYITGIFLLLLAVDFNNTRYENFRIGYNLYASEGIAGRDRADPSVRAYFDYGDSLSLQRGRDFYVSQRSLWVALTAIAWLVNVLDAAVYAHLSGFNLSEKVKLHIRPTIPSYSEILAGTSYGGISFCLRF